MKKGVLLALLGINEIQGVRINQALVNAPAATTTTAAANTTAPAAAAKLAQGPAAANASNSSAVAKEQQENDAANAQIDKQTKAEMEAFDDQADQEAEAAYGSDEDSYAQMDLQLEADAMDAANGPKSPVCPSAPRAAGETRHACLTEHCLHKNNKDSSDDECTCKPAPYTAANETKIMSIQAKRKADAEAAKTKANVLRKKAEEAVEAAHKARLDALKLSTAASDKASALAVKATKAAQKKINKEGKWKQKTSLVESEQKDLKVKRTTHEWEETVVAKHEMWATYRTIKKELAISSKNVHAVRHQLAEAESKVVRLKKLAALNPKDIGNKEKIAEAEKLVSVVGKQQTDADTQNMKVEEEMKTTLAKAQQASINSAKAKASAESAFRQMVISNNRVCNLCEHGKEKIAKRRAEIAAAIREETKRKAERMARRHGEKEQRRIDKERQCRSLGLTSEECKKVGPVPAAAPRAALAQQVSAPVTPVVTPSLAVSAPVEAAPKSTMNAPVVKANTTAPATAAKLSAPVEAAPAKSLAQAEKKPVKKSHKKASKSK